VVFFLKTLFSAFQWEAVQNGDIFYCLLFGADEVWQSFCQSVTQIRLHTYTHTHTHTQQLNLSTRM